jgi:adenylate cyclase
MPDARSQDSVAQPPDRRKLIAVMYADMVGYSRLIGLDDAGTLNRLRLLRGNLIEPAIEEHGGRIVQTGGDSLLIVFDSIDGAVRCGLKVQRELPTHDDDHPPDQEIRFRVGINIGDAIADGTDLHGDSVNVAARLQAECPPGGICVSRSVRDHVHGRLNLDFEALGALNLKNIAYPVEAFVVRLDPDASSTKPATGIVRSTPDVVELPNQPSIAVLPFAGPNENSEQDYFGDGMAEEIITALSRISWLLVIAHDSSFTYRGQGIDVKQIGRELGVRYLLKGSVRRSASRVRISVQLIEATTGNHLWADRFDGSIEDVFALQDKVAISVAGVIEPTLQAAETVRSRARPTADLDAYDAYLRAFAMHLESATQNAQALDLLEQAIARDPRYGPALACAACCCMRLVWDGLSQDPTKDERKVADYARRALQVAGDDPVTIANAAIALAHIGDDISVMIALVDRALALNPSFARGWHVSSHLKLFAGEVEAAIRDAETALRLSPRSRVGPVLCVIGIAHFFNRHFDEAVPKLHLAVQEEPTHPLALRALAACYAHMGRLDEARKTVERLRSVTPMVVPTVVNWRNSGHRELYLSGLRLAAGEFD